MRTRILIACGVVAVIALILVVAVRGGRDPAEDSPVRSAAIPHGSPVARTALATQQVLQFDDDPPGTLRLEGQVIDDHDHPVAGATVVIGSNPARELRTEADGSFAFDGLTPRTYYVGARTAAGNAGPVAVQLGKATEPVILRIREAAQIVVTVTTDGAKPVKGALVELRDLVSTTAISDDAGRATLAGVGPGWHVIKASAEGHASTFIEAASTGDAGGVTHVEIVLHAGASVAGTVVDPAGTPIEGARVLPEHLGHLEDRYDSRYDAVLTDAKGRWRLTGLPRDTTRIRAYHSAYAPGASSPLVLGDDGVRTGVIVVLDRGGRVTGRVVDTTGAPVAGAEVRVSADTVLVGHVRRVATDAAGTFAIAGLPRQLMYSVAASETASSPTVTIDLRGAEPAPIELRLDLGGELAGVVVTQAGEPVAEARVIAERARHDNLNERVDDRLRGSATTIATSDGTFRITGLPPGTYLVRAIRPGSSSHLLYARLGVPIETGAASARIVVDDLATLAGKVVFADGTPVPRFAVQLGTGPLKSFATGDGAFVVDEVPAGKQFVRISGADFVTHTLPEVTVAATRATDLGTITVQGGRTIAGIVVDRGGRGIAGASVVIGRELSADGTALVPYPDHDLLQTVTGADGRFAIRGVSSGSQQIAADHEAAGRSVMTPLPGGATDLELTLALRATGVVQGFVRIHGKPAEAIVLLRSLGQAANARMVVRTGADGSYRFDRVAADKYTHAAIQISARKNDGADGKMNQIEVPPGGTVTYDVDLTPSGVALVLHVTSPDNSVKFGYGTAAMVDDSVRLTTLPKTFSEARALASQVQGFEIREGMIVERQQVVLENVRPGRCVVCAAPFRGDPSDPAVIAELQQNRVDWPIYCKWVEVTAAPDPQHVTVEVQPLPPLK